MSASLHSQASSRPQSHVSGVPVAAQESEMAAQRVEARMYMAEMSAQRVEDSMVMADMSAQRVEEMRPNRVEVADMHAVDSQQMATIMSRGAEADPGSTATTQTTTTYAAAPMSAMVTSTQPMYQHTTVSQPTFHQTSMHPSYHQSTTTTTTTTGVTGGVSTVVKSSEIDPSMFGENCYTHTRKVSNVIVSETLLGEVPQQDEVRYVEADPSRFPPEERVIHVIKKEVREKIVEKKVPTIEWVDRVVEVPKIEYVDRNVVVEKIEEVYVDQRVPQVVDRYVDVIKEIPVTKENVVTKIVEVPGETIEVPKYYDEYVEKEVYRAVETEKPVIVAQVVKPIIKESTKQLTVDVMDYEPEVIPVDVHVAKPVNSALELIASGDVHHRLVNITSAQYNTILKQLNSHVDIKFQQSLPYVRENGQTLFLRNEQVNYIEAPADIRIAGYTSKVEPAQIEVMSRGPASAYTSAVAYRGGCPTNITQAMQTCTQGIRSGMVTPVVAVETAVPVITTETRSVQATGSTQAAPVVSVAYGNASIEVPRSTVEAAQSLIQSIPAQSTTEEVKITTRDMAPMQVGSEVRRYPGAASLPREGGSIRSQLPSYQPSRICC